MCIADLQIGLMFVSSGLVGASLFLTIKKIMKKRKSKEQNEADLST